MGDLSLGFTLSAAARGKADSLFLARAIPRVTDLLEKPLLGADLLGMAEQRADHSSDLGLERDDVLAARQHRAAIPTIFMSRMVLRITAKASKILPSGRR